MSLVAKAAPRRFVLIGQQASASSEFLLDDIAGTSGRLDVLIRSTRAALLVSHGVRQDVVVYMLLLGGPDAPRTIRIEGATVRFVRPDERNLGGLVKKTLERAGGFESKRFVELRTGLSVANAGLDLVLDDLAAGGVTRFCVLDANGTDIREPTALEDEPAVYFLGDHLGFDPSMRDRLTALGAHALSVGPTVVHTEDAIAVLSNELDRRGIAAR